MIKEKTCPDCGDDLYQDEMSSDLICGQCETCFAKDFDDDDDDDDKKLTTKTKG